MRLAADSVANVPANLAYALANVPANEVYALNLWADAIEGGGSWWLKTPTNAWGWDPGNPPMAQALTAILVPFPVISGSGGVPDGIDPRGGEGEPITADNSILGGSAPPGTLGYMANVILAAELPMHEGCGFECNDVLTTLGGFFQVPLSELMAGYQFGTVVDSNDPNYPVAWSGQTAEPLDPVEPFRSFATGLMADPSGNEVKTVSFADLEGTATRLNDSGTVAFDPLVEDSFLFTGFPLYDADTLVNGLVDGLAGRATAATPIPLPAPDSAQTVRDAPSSELTQPDASQQTSSRQSRQSGSTTTPPARVSDEPDTNASAPRVTSPAGTRATPEAPVHKRGSRRASSTDVPASDPVKHAGGHNDSDVSKATDVTKRGAKHDDSSGGVTTIKKKPRN